jgi:hypothetical protein
VRVCLALWLALCTACAASPHARKPERPRTRLPERFHYEIRLSDDLARIDASVCFDGETPKELRPGKDVAASRLRYARFRSPGPVHRLEVIGGRIQLDSDALDACIEYGIDLSEGGPLEASVRRVGRDRLASPNVWLYRPERRAKHVHAELTLHLPPGIQASLPWPQRGARYVLGSDAFRFDSYAAFGRFTPLHIEHRGVEVEVAALDGPLRLDAASTERWVRGVIDLASGMDGQFPTSRAQILLVPAGAYAQPVVFGMVARGGAGSILLFVSSEADETALAGDWVLPHELSHLFLPFVRRQHAWLPEGLATYYQEVLRARAGVVSELDTLRDLAAALASAEQQGTGRTLAEESTAMYETAAFRAVYWGGAAYFLMADVELRRRSEGAVSLDSVLHALRTSPRREEKFTDRTLLAHMDELAGMDVFVPLAEAALSRPFPDYAPLLEALGVDRQGGLQLDDTAPLAAIRRGIFAKREGAQ